MKKILAPTDFSEFANYAIEYAAFFAQRSGGTLCVATVIKNKADYQAAEDKLEEIKKIDYLKHVTITTIIKIGDSIRDQILEAAKDFNADLVIMGSNGASLVSEILLGSNAEKVIRKSNFSVLTIKHQMITYKLNSIVFASNFSDKANAAFPMVRDLAKMFNSKIYLLKINTPSHFEPTRISLEKINRFIKAQNLDTILDGNYEIALYADSTEELGILNFSIENEIDLISIANHGKRMLWKFLSESTSHNLVNHSFRPVLTVKV